ncbi:Spy/CpxP family protein refolding chaperone [Mesorhizobium sp. AaZ16]|uniref:Spy/CpxP family protein refolding chaperone n=1 Tax=Mesorhizobium sp. AaZ16 TaxID=3402289 RepID=UPI00374E240D
MEPNPQKKSWRKRIAIAGIAIVAFAGVGVAGALSQDYERMQSFGMGWADGGPGMHMQPNFLDGFERFLEEIDATPEQKKKLEAIRDEFFFDVSLIMLGFLDTLDDFDKLPTIDREAAEKLRAEFVAAVDGVLRKLTKALFDGAAVLTPEQRGKLVEQDCS